MFLFIFRIQTEKTTVISGIAVRETSVSRHYLGQLWAPLKPSLHLSTIVLKGFKGGA